MYLLHKTSLSFLQLPQSVLIRIGRPALVAQTALILP